MTKYTTDKLPAFFRAMSPELFFEAEALETDSILADLNSDVELDKELEALLERDFLARDERPSDTARA